MIFDVVLRLEPDPHQRDLARGWAAELADPTWMLGRQWQLGEHQGEDASSPVAVEVTPSTTLIRPVDGQEELDPATVPAQALLESEPDDWWTVGRRVRLGRAAAVQAEAEGINLPASTRMAELSAPYNALDGEPDGRELWRRRSQLGLEQEWFGPVTPPVAVPVDLWDPATLSYSATMTAGGTTLSISRHDGGPLDWYHADADGPIGTGGTDGTGGTEPVVRVTPGRLRYPSAPLPRWWQIEDAQVSIGGQAPDRSGLATLVLVDLIVNHSDDWYTISLPVTAGTISTLEDVTVIDSFGDRWPLRPPEDWSLFATQGLTSSSLVVWATAPAPLAGPVVDGVLFGMDEDANLIWAVEQVVAGRTLASSPPDPQQEPQPSDGAPESGPPRRFAYRAMTPVPRYWHPYVLDDSPDIRRRFVQGRAADLSGPDPVLMPEPISDLLHDPRAANGDPVHHLEPAAIPAEGVRVQRRAMLARSTQGAPVLWHQRRRESLSAPPVIELRFDILRPE
jgi:hypothetical protein